ncbi:MAG: cadmium-translocating P-type ATPase, partial [Candidatus Methanomethylophilaceae archaeon]|nr:cadmium-translocating P-type ATPase [Candidatus Methanomethylophilaceae archaeon]
MSSLDRFIGILSGIPATAIAGIFLVLSFALPRAGYQEYEALAWICVIICGIPLLYLSVWRIIHNKGISKISSALLITIAMGAALYIGDLFAAGEVAFIMQIGAILEDMTVNRSKKGLKNLISSIPETGRRVENGKETEIPVSEIRVSDIIRVKPGETIPVDGTVISGETAVNQAAMTGESIPADKTRGSSVFSGTVNLYGSVDIAATKRGEDSSLQKIVKLIEEADGKQADTQRIADKWASWLVPLASLVAVAAYFLTGEIVRAVTVLVVFCPCALVLSTPTAISAAIGQATKHGVMIKSGLALEKLGSAKTICFDKTGTLTEGTLKVDSVDLQARISENELLSIAASAELRSEHPVGKAIVKEAESRNIRVPQPESFSARPGIGVEADIGGKRYTVKKADSGMRTGGRTAVSVFSGDKILGTVFLSDSLRPETASAVSELSGMGVKT